MHARYNFAIVGLMVLLGVTPIFAGGPPNPTPSDAQGNTAGGTQGSLYLAPSSADNTGFGALAFSASQGLSNNVGVIGSFFDLGFYDGNVNFTEIGNDGLDFVPQSTATNTSIGFQTGAYIGTSNTATGTTALENGIFHLGAGNTATGTGALQGNPAGQFDQEDYNTATGAFAILSNNGLAYENVATGYAALVDDTTGNYNLANGEVALFSNTTGNANTAVGRGALYDNTTANANVAIGSSALVNNTTGSNNIALGYGAGQYLTTGSGNIDIGSPGVAAENITMRIGMPGVQKATYIAGISGDGVIGDSVVVNSAGQLGIVVSSARFKRNISDMGTASDGLMKLRPVSFRYKNDDTGALQYGLVAEDVAHIYPELVSYGPDGKPMAVRYWMLNAMLLNELQKQIADEHRLAAEVSRLSAQLIALKTATARELARFRARREQTLGSTRSQLAALELSMKAFGGNRTPAEPAQNAVP